MVVMTANFLLLSLAGGSQILTPEGFLKEVKGLSNSAEDASDE